MNDACPATGIVARLRPTKKRPTHRRCAREATRSDETSAASTFESAEGWTAEIGVPRAPDEAPTAAILSQTRPAPRWRSAYLRTIAHADWVAASLTGSLQCAPVVSSSMARMIEPASVLTDRDRDRGRARVRHRPSWHHPRLPARIRPAAESAAAPPRTRYRNRNGNPRHRGRTRRPRARDRKRHRQGGNQGCT